MTSTAEGGRKFLAFFFVQIQDFSGKITNFGAFQNFTDVRFGTFSISTGASFGENEIATDFSGLWGGGQIERSGCKFKKNDALAESGCP